MTRLLRPSPALLSGFRAALERGWSADNVRGAVAAQETLQRLYTDPHNLHSRRVITANGGTRVEHFNKGAAYGDQPGLRYRIDLV